MEYLETLRQQIISSGQARVIVIVKVGEPKTQILEIRGDGAIKIAIHAIPEKNAANFELIRFFDQNLNLPHLQVKIIAGLKERHKTLVFKL